MIELWATFKELTIIVDSNVLDTGESISAVSEIIELLMTSSGEAVIIDSNLSDTGIDEVFWEDDIDVIVSDREIS